MCHHTTITFPSSTSNQNCKQVTLFYGMCESRQTCQVHNLTWERWIECLIEGCAKIWNKSGNSYPPRPIRTHYSNEDASSRHEKIKRSSETFSYMTQKLLDFRRDCYRIMVTLWPARFPKTGLRCRCAGDRPGYSNKHNGTPSCFTRGEKKNKKSRIRHSHTQLL